MYMKIHEGSSGKVVAVCDKELVGKVLEDDKTCMDLEKYHSFYVGESVGKSEVESALATFASANLVGEKAVAIALSLGLVGKDDVMYINKTPYIQIYKI
jgi:hypothetical protein